MMMNPKFLMLCLALFITLPVQAKEKKYSCFVCAKTGEKMCVDIIPPECASSERMVIEEGVIKLQENNNQKKVNVKDQQAENVRLEAKRHDDALLSTYSNEQEVDLARDRNLQQVNARTNSYTTLLKSAQDNLTALKQEFAKLNNEARKIPKSLEEDIHDSTTRVAKLQKDLEASVKEQEAVKARYAAEKARYRELKGSVPQDQTQGKSQPKQ
jgi:hypothetical protein